MSLEVRQDRLFLNGAPFQMIGGAMHYFRIHPELWGDRLLKARQCGLNTIDTYCCWNLHEPREGEFRFDGWLDVARFVRLAGELGLHVVLRPGPYICSEWDLGALPAWLPGKPGLQLRRRNEPFLTAVDRYFAQLLPRLAPLQSTHGGPIIAMQVENEYGGFGKDTAYLEAIASCMARHGVDVLMLTSDGASERMQRDGALPGRLQTVNFRNHPEQAFALARKVHPGQPAVAMEYWSGMGHLCGKPYWHHRENDVAAETEWMLRQGASLSFYMFHGGTNFGFMNGARIEGGRYWPHLTSYDVDAPLNEAGDPTPKYYAIQQAIARCLPQAHIERPAVSPKRAYGTIRLEARLGLLDALPQLAEPVHRPTPQRFEDLGQAYGFMLYRTRTQGQGLLELGRVRDRAQVFLDGVPVGTVHRDDSPEPGIVLEPAAVPRQLDILVENLGRVNCGGENLLDCFKGLLDPVRCGGAPLQGWEHYSLPLANIGDLRFAGTATAPAAPLFLQGRFRVDHPADTFLKVPGGHRGVCWINGFNLGRYWSIGPQQSLYVPGPLLSRGWNTVTVLELHNRGLAEVVLADEPEFSDRRDLIL